MSKNSKYYFKKVEPDNPLLCDKLSLWTNTLCIQKEIPAEKQPKVFRTINVLITILLVSSYIEVSFT